MLALLVGLTLPAACAAPDNGGGNYQIGGDGRAGDASPCASLTIEERDLFTVLSVAGASNSIGSGAANPAGVGDHTNVYYGKLLSKAWERIGSCTSYDPEVWRFSYTEVAQTPSTTTVSICLDAFFHFLDDDPPVATFRSRVQGYLDTFAAAAPSAVFIGANVPQSMMFVSTATPAEYAAVMREEMDARPTFAYLDVDYFFTQLQGGKINYDGQPLAPGDILIDPVHLNDLGQQVVADLYIELLNTRFPGLRLPTYAEMIVQP